MNVPSVVYADFEAFTKPVDTWQPNPMCSYTNQYQPHAYRFRFATTGV